MTSTTTSTTTPDDVLGLVREATRIAQEGGTDAEREQFAERKAAVLAGIVTSSSRDDVTPTARRAAAMKTYSPCPSWCLRAHKSEPFHYSAEAHVSVSAACAPGETVDAVLVDVGGIPFDVPKLLVRVGWKGAGGQLLAPDAAVAYGLHLIRLAALAGGEQR